MAIFQEHSRATLDYHKAHVKLYEINLNGYSMLEDVTVCCSMEIIAQEHGCCMGQHCLECPIVKRLQYLGKLYIIFH